MLHQASGVLVVGFSNGVFALYEMPDFNNIHSLSVSQSRINSTAVNASGEWLVRDLWKPCFNLNVPIEF